MKKYIILNKVLIYILLLANNAFAQSDKYDLKIGTGSINGIYYSLGSGLCKIYNTYRLNKDSKCSALLSYGSADNIENLKSGLLNFSLTQTEILKDSYKNSQETDIVGNDDIRSVFSLHPEILALVIRENSKINQISDIKNKKINICHPGSGTRKVIDKLFKYLNYSYNDFTKVTQSHIYQQAEDLCKGEIDVASYFVGNPNAAMKEVMNLCKIRILSFSDDELNGFTKSYPEYSKEEIPAGFYPSNNNDIKTFGSEAILITSKHTDNEIVYQFVKNIFEHIEEFKKIHPALKFLNLEEMSNEKNLIPFHEGAIRFYKERALKQ